MAVLNFFKRNKKAKAEIVKTSKPSQEQASFADNVLEIFSPALMEFGFVRHRTEIATHSTTIIFRKDKQYIKVESSTYPTDYPFYYYVTLGEGDSEDFYEWDWNSIALWRLKGKISPTSKAEDYKFPFNDQVRQSVVNAKDELLNYGVTFLKGDLTLFYETRIEQNKNREPYKIYSTDKNGNYQTTYEPKSVEQKKKYS